MSREAIIYPGDDEIQSSETEEYFAFPLTSAQTAMLPIGLNSTGDPRFNGAFRMSLDGRLDVVILQQAISEIIQRHEVFRTRFQVQNAEVVQVVYPESNAALEVVDLRLLDEPQRVVELDLICLEEAQQGFDLSHSAPVRMKLIQLADDHYIFTLTVHQIICDGWSMGLFMEELSKIYSAFARREESPLSPLGFQYGDYVVWQQENLQRPEVQAQLDYWKEKLSGCREFTFPADAENAVDSIEGVIVSQLLSRDLTDKLRALGQSENTTFFVVAMSACMALLHRYTGESDLTVRTPLAGRSRIEFEPIIGQFTNHVVIRSIVAEEPTFLDLISQVKECVWEALAHQEIPFEQVLRGLSSTHASNSDPFRINFVCQREYGRNGPFEFNLDEVKMTTLPSKSQGALYDLNFFLVEREVGWRLSLEYKTGLYSQQTAENLIHDFQDILLQISTNPQSPISELKVSKSEATTQKTIVSPADLSPEDSVIDDGSLLETVAMPASLAQERFWALSQIDASDPTFHIPVVMKLTGELSPGLLEQSFQLLIDRHETLRTYFAETGNDILQIISPAYSFALPIVDLQDVEGDAKASRLAEVIGSEVQTAFELSALPLIRALLCSLGGQEHVLIITIHHILADAWSVQVIQRELWGAYESLSLGKDVSLAPLALQYGDFSVWQREGLSSPATQSHLNYWLKVMGGTLPVLDLPTDSQAEDDAGTAGAISSLLLAPDLTSSLKQFAQSTNVTFFVVTLACFALFLGRASDAEDLVIGSPVVNRRSETEQLIGPFAGPVPLRFNLSGDPTLRELVLAIQKMMLEVLAHTDLPFEALLENLNVRPVGGRNPLFQFYFFCQPAFLQVKRLHDLTVTPLPTMSVGIPFELQLGVIEREEGVRAELEYKPHLFKKSTIEAWLEYYGILLTSLVSNPDQRVSELPSPPRRTASLTRSTESDLLIPSRTGEATGALKEKSSSGKAAASAAALSQQHADNLTAELLDVWRASLGIATLDSKDDFFAVGGRSLVAARLIAKINKRYSLKLGLSTLFNFPTVEELAHLIRGELTSRTPSSIIAIQPKGGARPLFLIHGVGGNVLNFYDLGRELGNDQPVYGIEAQALQMDKTPITTLEDLSAYYIRELRKVQPTGPYSFLGYSYGGFVAFEMAHQLLECGQEVEFLGMLDTPIWRHGVREGRSTAAKVGRQLRAIWAPFFQRLRPLTPKEIFDGIKSTLLRSYYTMITSSGRQIHQLLRSVYHLNSFAAVNYVPKLFDGTITMFRSSAERGPEDLGWGKFTTQQVIVYGIPGAHLQVLSQANLPKVVESLRISLGMRKK